MTRCLLTLTLLSLSAVPPLIAQDFAIVSTDRAYLLNTSGQIVGSVRYLSTWDIVGQGDDFVEVRHPTLGNVRISQAFVQLSTLFDYLHTKNSEPVRSALKDLHDARIAYDNGRGQESVALARKALAVAETAFENVTPGYAWLLAHLAYFEYATGDPDAALQSLDRAVSTIESLNASQYLENAQICNIRSVLLLAQGQLEPARQQAKAAVAILTRHLGAEHADLRIYYQNLSVVNQALGQNAQAIEATEAALRICRESYPEAAIERPLEERRLAELQMQAEQFDTAIANYRSALQQLGAHHPDNHYETALTQFQIGDAYQTLGNYQEAETWYVQALDRVRRTEGTDGKTQTSQLQKEILNRQGYIDYLHAEYADALEHFLAAVELADADRFESLDGLSHNNAANAFAKLGRNQEARKFYQSAIDIYVRTDGKDSDVVAVVTDLLKKAGGVPANVSDVVLVAFPRGYVTVGPAADAAVEVVPGLSVLEVTGTAKDAFDVRLPTGKIGRISASQVRSGQMIPGIGEVGTDTLRTIMQHLGTCQREFLAGQRTSAMQHLQQALNTCQAAAGVDSELYLWLRIMQVHFQVFQESPAAAGQSLQQIRGQLRSHNAQGYPLLMDLQSAEGTTFSASGDNREAVQVIRRSLDTLDLRLGSIHADGRTARRSLGSALWNAGEAAAAIDQLRQALQIAERIYPRNADEVVQSSQDLALLLFASGSTQEAVRLLDAAINTRSDLVEPKTTALAIVTLARVHRQQDDVAQARQLLNDALAKLESAEQMESDVAATTLAEVGFIAFQEQQFPQAKASLNQAVRIYRKLGTDQSYDAAAAFATLGDVYRAETDWRNARLNFTRTLDIYQRLGLLESEEGRRIAGLLQTMPQVTVPSKKNVYELLNYDLELPDSQRMLVTTQDAPIMDAAEVMQTVSSGMRLWSLTVRDGWHQVMVPGRQTSGWISEKHVADLNEQLVLTLSAQAVQRNANNPQMLQRVQQVLVRGTAAMQLLETQGLRAATQELEQLLGQVEEIVGEDNVLMASVRSQLADVYFQDRQFVKSRQLIELAIPLQREVWGDDHPFIARELWRLAGLLARIGDFSGQQKALEEALEIIKARFPPDDPRITGLRLRIASSLETRGHQSEAEAMYRRIVELETERYSVVTPPMAAAHAGLGRLRILDGNFEQAEALHQQAITEFAELGDAFQVAQGNALFDLGHVQFLRGQFAAARDSLAAAEKILGQGDVSAETKAGFASLRRFGATRENNWSAAFDLAEECLQHTIRAYGPDSAAVIQPLAARGQVHAMLDRPQQAAADFDRSRRLTQNYVVNTLADQPVANQISFLKSNDNAALHTALSLGTVANAGPEIRQQSATWLLNAKNIANELAARDAQIRKLLSAEADVAAYERWLDASRRIATLPRLTPEEAASQQLSQTEDLLKQQRAAAFEQLPQMARTEIERQRHQWVLCDDVRKLLAEDEVLIEIVRMRIRINPDAPNQLADVSSSAESYVAWIIPAAGHGDVSVVNLGNAKEIDDTLVTPLLDEIGRSLPKIRLLQEEQAVAQLVAVSEKLTDRVWAPVAATLPAGTKRITLCPDSTLWRVPWPALPGNDDRFLVEDFLFRFVSSGRDLLAGEASPVELSAAMILADPDFGATDVNTVQSVDTDQVRSISILDPTFDVTALQKSLPKNIRRLPGTSREATAIQTDLDNFSGAPSTVLLGQDASELAFRQVYRPHTLMVGTHGFFLPELKIDTADVSADNTSRVRFDVTSSSVVNPLRRCGLLLAGCSTARDQNVQSLFDGILTGEEIILQDLLGTKLVVLSACETGLGDLTDGQGVAGLRQAFQLAGARSVVSTLWEIEDRETASLVSELFKNLAQGHGAAAALRDAQLSRIEYRRNRFGAAHPFFWAAFTLTGQD